MLCELQALRWRLAVGTASAIDKLSAWGGNRPNAVTPRAARKPPVISHSGQPKQAPYALVWARLSKGPPGRGGGTLTVRGGWTSNTREGTNQISQGVIL